MTVATYTVTSMAAGEEDRIVKRIYNISSDTSSEYDTDRDSDGEMSSRNHSVPECTTSSTTETTQSETVSNSARSLLSVLRRPTSSDLCRKRVIRTELLKREVNFRFYFVLLLTTLLTVPLYATLFHCLIIALFTLQVSIMLSTMK